MMNGKIESLKDIFEAQKKRQKDITGDVTPVDNPLKMMLHCSSLVTEIGEVMQSDTRWKKYIGKEEGYEYSSKDKILEFCDCLNYLVNMCLFSNIDFEDLIAAYNIKHERLLKKYGNNC